MTMTNTEVNDALTILVDRQLMRSADGVVEDAVVGTEYYSPAQHGGIYGTVYRQYHGALVNNETITATGITNLLSYAGVFNGDVCYDGHTGDGSGVLYINRGTNLVQAHLVTWTLTKGWFDYTK